MSHECQNLTCRVENVSGSVRLSGTSPTTSSLPPETIGVQSSPSALASWPTPFTVLAPYFPFNKSGLTRHNNSCRFSSWGERFSVEVESARHSGGNSNVRSMDGTQIILYPHLARPTLGESVLGWSWAKVKEGVTSNPTITISPVFAAVAIAALPCISNLAKSSCDNRLACGTRHLRSSSWPWVTSMNERSASLGARLIDKSSMLCNAHGRFNGA